MKRIILSLAVIAIAGIGAVGATRAYFSTSATVTGNTFSSGTLGLTISDATHPWTTGWTASTSSADLYPGQTGDMYLEMQKTGTTPNTKGTISLAATAGLPSDLASHLRFTVYFDATDTYDVTRASYTNWATTTLHGYTLAQLSAAGNPKYDLGTFASDGTGHVDIRWTVDTSLTTQGQSVTLNTVLGATQ